MVFETASGLAGAQVPQPQGLVPGAGQGEVSIRGEDDVGDEVAVTVEPLLGHTVVLLISGQLPDDQGLVAGGRQDHVRVFRVGGDLGDPAIVSFEGTAQRQRLSHVETEFFSGSRLENKPNDASHVAEKERCNDVNKRNRPWLPDLRIKVTKYIAVFS